MKKYIHPRNNLKTKYQRLRQKIERAIKNGRFYRYTKRRQNQLLKRLQSYYQRIVRTGQLALPVAGLIIGAASISQAQTFTLETTTASPFVNLNVNPDAPFGLSDVGYSSTPTFVDIDGDGDLDAFVGEEDGNINYFENTNSGAATSNSPVFSLLSTDGAFGLSDVGNNSSPTFVDIDGDGDLDAFVGERDGNINYFENTNSGAATSNSPVFSLLSTDGAFGLSDVGRYSIPSFVDIDGDGDLDAFVGEYYGNIYYFENTNSGSATSNSPVFSLLSTDGAFGLSDVGLYSNPSFVDIDNDGDLDAFVGENEGNINYFENTNSGAATSNSPVFSLLSTDGAFGLSNGDYNSAPTFVDIDGDGDLDAFVGRFDGRINYFENVNSGAATSNSSVFIFPVTDIGDNSAPSFVDIDGDGDLDAFVGEFDGNIKYFKNTNSGASTSNSSVFIFSASSEPFGLSDVGIDSAPTFVDIDGDGDLDAFVGEFYGNINYFENQDPSVGTAKTMPTFVSSTDTAPFGLTDVGYSSVPSFVDIDGDGDLDAFVGEFDGNINYFENQDPSVGTAKTMPTFVSSTNTAPFGLSDIGFYSDIAFVDIDGDGDLDAFVGEEDGNINYFENTSTNSSIPAFAAPISNTPFGLTDVGRSSSPTVIDIDNDGLFEAVIGNGDGRLNYFESDIPVLGEAAFNCSLNILPLPNTLLKSGSYSTKKSIVSSSIIAADSTVTFLAADSIVLQQGFHARAGSSFTASIGSCSTSSSNDNELIENRTEELSETPSTLNSSQLNIFPNPVSDQLFIKNATGQARILNMLGQVVQQFEIDRPIFNLDVSTLVSGQYILIVQQSNDEIVIQQFVK